MTRYEFLVNYPNMDIDTNEEATMMFAQCSKREPKQTAEPKPEVKKSVELFDDEWFYEIED